MPSSTWPVHVDSSNLYFITTGAVKRQHVFRRDVIKRILVDSLNIGRILKQYELFAFVIMPNHVHFIIRCLNEYTSGDVVREFKKSTSGLILRQHEAEGNHQTLAFFASMVKSGQKRDYAVWEEEYQPKNIYSPGFFRQNLEYVHNNPLQPQGRLAEHPEEYVWSSARFYLSGDRPLIPLSDARELLV